jgi:hypothetical protein
LWEIASDVTVRNAGELVAGVLVLGFLPGEVHCGSEVRLEAHSRTLFAEELGEQVRPSSPLTA